MPLGGPRRLLSFTLNRPGFARADRLLWREVRNADLTPELDTERWLAAELAARDASDVPCFLTSRDIALFEAAEAAVEGVRVRCVATIGLSNAERVGRRMARDGDAWGTVNIAIDCDLPLAEAALIEALTIVAQARTAALLAHGPRLATGRATGTGTDCIAVAAPEGGERFAGLHTPQGEAIGRAAHDAVARGTRAWMKARAHGG